MTSKPRYTIYVPRPSAGDEVRLQAGESVTLDVRQSDGSRSIVSPWAAAYEDENLLALSLPEGVAPLWPVARPPADPQRDGLLPGERAYTGHMRAVVDSAAAPIRPFLALDEIEREHWAAGEREVTRGHALVSRETLERWARLLHACRYKEGLEDWGSFDAVFDEVTKARKEVDAR